MTEIKSITFLIMIIGLFSFHSIAQEEDDVKDPKAKAFLDKLSEKNKAYSTLTINFSYNLSNKDQNINETQMGVLRVKGPKYKIKLDKFEITSDGKTRWMYMKEVNEVQIEDANSDEEDGSFLNPSELFNMHKQGFKYKYKGQESIGKNKYDVVKLFPEDAADKPYHTVMLYIDDSNQLYQTRIFSKDGNRYTYTLDKIIPNLEMEEDYFKFDTSEVDDVIDLR